MSKYIVIINRYGTPVLMEDSETEKEAENNGLAQAAGYEIIDWNYKKD